MSKAVLATKPESPYDDLPEVRYHFPATYLRQVETAIGDWIVYYEPRRTGLDPDSRGGRQAYFATARVVGIRPDPRLPGHLYADIADYLEFDRPVPFLEGSRYYESALRRDDGKTNRGAFGRAVRQLPEAEYDAILRAGFAPVLGAEAPAVLPDAVSAFDLTEDTAPFERPIIERLVARPFRDAAFAEAVKRAYAATCAVTGIRIVNGGGRAEVQAAHIRPVASAGPDSLRNGIALCGTAHWMFDRGLLSLTDDGRILLAESKLPEPARRLLHPDGQARLPSGAAARPHPQFLRFHRECVFKG